MPGGIDTHVHLEHPIERLGVTTADDFHTGTVAAACGGTTCIIDFALQKKGDSIERAVRRRMNQASQSVIDFGLHVILTDLRDEILSEIPLFIDRGYVSYKLFTTFGDKCIDDRGLVKVFEQLAPHGGLAYVHCENDGAIGHLIQKCLASGETGPTGHLKSRPPITEAEAANRAIALADMMGASICIAHVTSKETVEVIEVWRKRGARVVSETCPQYLSLSSEKLAPEHGFDAARYVCTPPLRDSEHQTALWQALERGALQQVSSDHSSFPVKDREMGRGNFTRIPNGLPGIETRLPILFSEGVSKGRFTANRFVELVATNPAKIFGLFPQKGSLSVGADADLVVVDPLKTWVIDHRHLHQPVDYSPYDGMSIRGAPILTISRGDIVVENGEPRANRGRGQFISRTPGSVE
jgi:dihydropyrimidinase